jgi:transposase
MITIPAGARILLATRPIDFRKGAHGLAALAQEVLGEDPFSGVVIVYRAKRSDRVKILVWDLRTPLIFQIAPNTFENSG